VWMSWMSWDCGSRELTFLARKFVAIRSAISPLQGPEGVQQGFHVRGTRTPPTPSLITPLDPARIEGVSPSAEITRTPKGRPLTSRGMLNLGGTSARDLYLYGDVYCLLVTEPTTVVLDV